MSGQVLDSIGSWQPVVSLLLGSLVVMGSPGPSTISATAVGAAFGFRRSMRYVAGLIAGTTAVLIAVAIGAVALLLLVPQSAMILGSLSVVYILYLAGKVALAPPLALHEDNRPAPGFVGGIMLALANPKAYLAIAAVFSGTTILVDHAIDALVKTALLTTMIVAIHLSWLFAGASLSRALHDPLTSRIVNVGLATILVATTFASFIA
jgi:threonine/homoserine/homoserine lactone efflux protein